MASFMQLVSRNLGRGLFGLWLIVMGIVFLLEIRSPQVLMALNILLGVLLVGSGVCTLLGR
jgi:hypothetical protein